jgi:hypothetical protein
MKNKVERTIKQLISDGNRIASSKTIYETGRANGLTYKEIHSAFLQERIKVGRGKYNVSLLSNSDDSHEIALTKPKKESRPAPVQNTQKVFADLDEVYVPNIDETFVQWGEFAMVKKIIDSRMFFPVYISGLSGNGKTMMVEQACAKSKREFVRVQISPETDETDLIGGFRLVDGETVFYKGPVVKAMERGAILLIDELDRGSNKIMCLQGVLEGKPVLLKKIGEVVQPAPGFNIFATANTKGRGSEDGRFSAANIIDEAFIERFVATIDQPYPSSTIEKNILLKHMTAYNVTDFEFADRLVSWSQIIRKTYENDGVDDLVSTRRLCHIVKAHSIFDSRLKSIAMCIARFDDDTRAAFNDLYTMVDAQPLKTAPPETFASNEIPF